MTGSSEMPVTLMWERGECDRQYDLHNCRFPVCVLLSVLYSVWGGPCRSV